MLVRTVVLWRTEAPVQTPILRPATPLLDSIKFRSSATSHQQDSIESLLARDTMLETAG